MYSDCRLFAVVLCGMVIKSYASRPSQHTANLGRNARLASCNRCRTVLLCCAHWHFQLQRGGIIYLRRDTGETSDYDNHDMEPPIRTANLGLSGSYCFLAAAYLAVGRDSGRGDNSNSVLSAGDVEAGGRRTRRRFPASSTPSTFHSSASSSHVARLSICVCFC